MHFSHWLCLVWILTFITGCGARPAGQTATAVASTTADAVALPQPSETATAKIFPTVRPTTVAPTELPLTPTPATFDACKAAGGQISDSIPRACQSGGVSVDEPLPEGIRFSHTSHGMVGASPIWVEPASDGGALITGVWGGIGLVVKINAAGNQEWVDRVGPEIEAPHYGEHVFNCGQAREAEKGGFAVLCYVFHRRSNELYLLRYEPDGRRIASELVPQKPGMALTLDAWGEPARLNTFGLGGGGVIETADGGYALIYVSSINGSDDRTRLVKADAQKRFAWDRLLCALTGITPQPDQIACHGNILSDRIQTQDGGFALTGIDSTHQGAYLIKTDAQGQTEWVRYYRDMGLSGGVRQLPDGGYLLAGTSQSDGFLLRVDPDGRPLSEKSLGGWSGDWLTDLVRLSNGDFLAVGTSRSTGSQEGELWWVGVQGK